MVASAVPKLLAPVNAKMNKCMAMRITCNQQQPPSKSSFRRLTSPTQLVMMKGCEYTLQLGCSVCQDKISASGFEMAISGKINVA